MAAKRAACPAVPRAPQCGGTAATRRHDRQHAATAAASPWRRRVAARGHARTGPEASNGPGAGRHGPAPGGPALGTGGAAL